MSFIPDIYSIAIYSDYTFSFSLDMIKYQPYNFGIEHKHWTTLIEVN